MNNVSGEMKGVELWTELLEVFYRIIRNTERCFMCEFYCKELDMLQHLVNEKAQY